MAHPVSAGDLRIEAAALADLDDIMAIERVSFSVPWTRAAIAEEIARPWSIFRVLRGSEGQLCAYLNFWVVYDELHILNIATHPDHRRRGCARMLLEQLLDESARNDVAEIALEVRRSNAGARQLYEGLGFKRVGTRPGYYSDTGEDAIVYTLRAREGVTPRDRGR